MAERKIRLPITDATHCKDNQLRLQTVVPENVYLPHINAQRFPMEAVYDHKSYENCWFVSTEFGLLSRNLTAVIVAEKVKETKTTENYIMMIEQDGEISVG